MSWASDYDEFWAVDLFGKGGFGNTGHVVSPTIDAEYVDFQSAMKEDEQNAIATKIFDEIHEQAYTVQICSEKINVLTSKRLKGVLPLTDPGQLTQFWWVDQ